MKELERTIIQRTLKSVVSEVVDNKYFHADAERGKREGKKPFTIVMPPPNITGQSSHGPRVRQYHAGYFNPL